MTVQATIPPTQSSVSLASAQADANSIAITSASGQRNAFDQTLTSVQRRYQVGGQKFLLKSDALPDRKSSQSAKTQTSRSDKRSVDTDRAAGDADRQTRSRREDRRVASSADQTTPTAQPDRNSEHLATKPSQDAADDPGNTELANNNATDQPTALANEQAEQAVSGVNAADKGQTFAQLLQTGQAQTNQLLVIDPSTQSDAQQPNHFSQPGQGQVLAQTTTDLNNVAPHAFAMQLEKSNPATSAQSNTILPALSVGSSGPQVALSSTGPQSLATPQPTLQAADSQDQTNVNRVVRSLATALQQRGGSVTLRLEPAQMGSVRVAVQIDQGQVQAAILAQTESARSLLTHEIHQLRYALESQGLQVQRITVQTFEQAQLTWGQEQGLDQSPSDGQSRGSFGQTDEDQPTPFDQETSDNQRENQTFSQALNEVA